MATTTDVAIVAPIEEKNLAPEAPEEEPSKKPEAAMAITTKATLVAPEEDGNPTLVADMEEEEAMLKKVDEAAWVEEAPNKVVVGGRVEKEEEEEDVRSEDKGGAFESLEVEVGGTKVDQGGNGNMDLEEAKNDVKGGISGIANAKKDDGNKESTTHNSEVSIYVVAPVPAPVLAVESKSENKGLGEDDASLSSLDVPKGEKGELQGGQQKDIGVVKETKFLGMKVDDAEFAVSTEEKMEHECEKGAEVVSVGVDDCEFGEETEGKVFVGSIEAIEHEDNVDLISKAKGELGEEKKASDDTVDMGGEEALEELTNKDVDVEDKAAKPELVIDIDSMVVHDGSVKKVVPASSESVFVYSPENETNVEGQAITSENVASVVQDGVDKHTDVENVAIMVEDIDVMKSTEVKDIDVVVQCLGVKNPTEIENVVVVVEGADVEKPTEEENVDTMVEDIGVVKPIEVEDVVVESIDVEKQIEVEIVAATSFDGIFSQELALKSSMEENDVEEAKSATGIIDPSNDDIIKVVIHDADCCSNKADEDDDGAKSNTSPAQVIILESNVAMKQIIKELVEGSSSGSQVDGDGGWYDGSEVEEAEEDAKGVILGMVKPEKDDGSRELAMEDMKVVSIVAQAPAPTTMPMPVVEYNIKKEEFGKGDASLASLDMLEGEDKGELREERQENVGVAVETKVVDMVVDDEKFVVDKEDKPNSKGEKGMEVDFEGMDGCELGKEKEVEIFAESIDIELDNKVDPTNEANDKEASDDTMTVGGEESIEKSIEDNDVEENTDMPKPMSKTSPMVMNYGSVKEVASTSADNMVKDSPENEQKAKDQSATSEAVEYFDVEKPTKVDDVAIPIEYSIEKHTEVTNVVALVEGVDVEMPMEIDNIDVAVEDICIKKPIEIEIIKKLIEDENIDDMVEDIGIEKPTEVENDVVAVECTDVEKPTEDENIYAMVEDIGVDNLTEVENVSTVIEGVDVEKPRNIEGVDVENVATVIEGVDVENVADGTIEVVVDDADRVGNEADKDDDGVNSDMTLVQVSILKTKDVAKQIMKKHVEGSSNDSEEEGDDGRDDKKDMKELEEDANNRSLVVAEDEKDCDRGEPAEKDKEVFVSVMVPTVTQVPVLESNMDSRKLGEEDAPMAFTDALEGEEKRELWDAQKERVGVVGGIKVADIIPDDTESTVIEEENPEVEIEKCEKVSFEVMDDCELDEDKLPEVFTWSIETVEQEDKVAFITEASGEKEANDYAIVVGADESIEESIENEAYVEDEVTKLEPTNEASLMIVSDGSMGKVVATQVHTMLINNLVKEQNDKGQTIVGEAMEDVTFEKPINVENVATMVEDHVENLTMVENIVVLEGVDVEKLAKVEKIDVEAKIIGVEKPIEIENIVVVEGDDVKQLTEDKNVDVVVEDIGVEKATEDENIVMALECVDIEKPTKFESVATTGSDGILSQELTPNSSKDNNGVEETECAIEGIDHEEKDDDVDIPKTMVDEPDVVGNEDDEDDVMNSDMSSTQVKMLKSTKVVKQIMKELAEGSSSDSEMEGDGGSLDVAEAKKDDGSGDLAAHGMEVAFSIMAPKIVIAVELKSKNKELVEDDAAMAFLNASEGEMKGELQEEVGLIVETEAVDMVVDDEEYAMAVEKKLSPKCGKSNEVGCGGMDGYGFDEEEEVEISIESIESTKPEDKVVLIAEVSDELGNEKEERDDTMDVEGKEDIEESKDKDVEVDNEATMHKPVNEGSPMVVNDESLEEVATASANIVLEDSLENEQNAECQTTVGLGSSASSMGPTTPCQLERFKIFGPLELAVNVDPSEEMTQEEKKLHGEVELIQENFLRLVYRLGATPKETVVAQVMYRLSLAGGSKYGRQSNSAFSHDKAWEKVVLLEEEGKQDLDFSCNILVLGKSGVGKSATINSIFGEAKSKTDAFSSATTSVQAFVGDVDGVKIRIIDTPGLQPNIMDQGVNRKILAAVQKYTKKFPPDVVVYVDRLDCLSYDLNDLPLLKTITSVLGSSIWFNTIVALTHGASTPPEGFSGAPMTYEVLMAQRSHIVQQSIRQAIEDMSLMNPISLVENHPSCTRNREGQKVLPNGQSWRHQMLLLCYSSKILSKANSLLMLRDPNLGKLVGYYFRSLPLPFLLSSLLQSRDHPKLSTEQGGNECDSNIELDSYSDVEQDDDEKQYDQIPPFKPLTKAQLGMLAKEHKIACFDEYNYRAKLHWKKQWKNEMKKRKNFDHGPLLNVSVPLPDMVLPPLFDCDSHTYRYCFLESNSTILARPILDAHRWDHDYGYDGVSMGETLAILNRFPTNVAVQITKDKKEFCIHLDSSIATKHGKNASSLAGFNIQTIGQHLAYILHGETKIKNIKKNKITGGFLVTILGDIVVTGLKVEDQLSLGKWLSLVASTGAIGAQGDTAYGANFEARLKNNYPTGQHVSTLGLSLMKWCHDLALGANLQSQFSIGRGSKMDLRLGINNKLSGHITVRTSTSEHVQIVLLGLVPVAASICERFWHSESSFT